VYSFLLQVVPTIEVTPPQTNGWKVTVAGILLVLLVASSVQLSLVANITKLPKVRRQHTHLNRHCAVGACARSLLGKQSTPSPWFAS